MFSVFEGGGGGSGGEGGGWGGVGGVAFLGVGLKQHQNESHYLGGSPILRHTHIQALQGRLLALLWWKSKGNHANLGFGYSWRLGATLA